jgi:hypothetical protein
MAELGPKQGAGAAGFCPDSGLLCCGSVQSLHRDNLLRRYSCDYTVARLLNGGHHQSDSGGWKR